VLLAEYCTSLYAKIPGAQSTDASGWKAAYKFCKAADFFDLHKFLDRDLVEVSVSVGAGGGL
jgi:hypothetical protein